ncbi:hypothetical protein [Streptomyces anthocyanicus]|uniref:hypothetical protein n=1 Tax=Streptomyces anthocyanicus TaxID=68174 RepID=UPI00364F0399
MAEGTGEANAPAAADLRPLLRGLQQRLVHPYVLSDVAALGASIAQSLRQAIAQADTVLVVLGSSDGSQSTLFEAGIAVGMGKRVIVIADPGVEISAGLEGLLTIRARPDDLEAIFFALNQAEGRLVPGPAAAMAAGHPLGDRRVNELLDLLHKARRERAVLEVLQTALEESGALTVQRPVVVEPNRFVDLGVWSDDLDAIALNPLLIEVKSMFSHAAVRQTLHLLQGSRMDAALLVYLHPPHSPKEMTEALEKDLFPVMAISLETLLERMRTSSFAEVVRDLRRRAVHGVPAT